MHDIAYTDKKMNITNELLSPTSQLRLRFDQISPETDEIIVDENSGICGVVGGSGGSVGGSGKKVLLGIPIPSFVSGKVLTWLENELLMQHPIIMYKDIICVKKVWFLICFVYLILIKCFIVSGFSMP